MESFNLNTDDYSDNDIKQLLGLSDNYTLDEIEFSKQKLISQINENEDLDGEKSANLLLFLDTISEMISNKLTNTNTNTNTFSKNSILKHGRNILINSNRDTDFLNQIKYNKIQKSISIDSRFRKDINDEMSSSTNYNYILAERQNKVTSMIITDVNIPTYFNNISKKKNNNAFLIITNKKYESDDTSNDSDIAFLLTVPDGNYNDKYNDKYNDNTFSIKSNNIETALNNSLENAILGYYDDNTETFTKIVDKANDLSNNYFLNFNFELNSFNKLQINTSLYNFNEHTFTSCDLSGANGPDNLSDCQQHYGNIPWITDEKKYYDVKDGFQYWIVPETSIYEFEVIGAQGDSFTKDNNNVSSIGGFGVKIIARYRLIKGHKIRIIVGQTGTCISSTTSTETRTFFGGGGASYIYNETTDTLLYVSGGGGGKGIIEKKKKATNKIDTSLKYCFGINGSIHKHGYTYLYNDEFESLANYKKYYNDITSIEFINEPKYDGIGKNVFANTELLTYNKERARESYNGKINIDIPDLASTEARCGAGWNTEFNTEEINDANTNFMFRNAGSLKNNAKGGVYYIYESAGSTTVKIRYEGGFGGGGSGYSEEIEIDDPSLDDKLTFFPSSGGGGYTGGNPGIFGGGGGSFYVLANESELDKHFSISVSNHEGSGKVKIKKINMFDINNKIGKEITIETVKSFKFNATSDGLINNSIKLQKTLGWLLGFRKLDYNIEKLIPNVDYIESESCCMLKNPMYSYISINDYNTNYMGNLSLTFADDAIIDKSIISKVNICSNSSNNCMYSDKASSNVLENQLDRKRVYFGPVDIQRLSIALFDEYGDVVDLNNLDWSFTLILEQLY